MDKERKKILKRIRKSENALKKEFRKVQKNASQVGLQLGLETAQKNKKAVLVVGGGALAFFLTRFLVSATSSKTEKTKTQNHVKDSKSSSYMTKVLSETGSKIALGVLEKLFEAQGKKKKKKKTQLQEAQ